MLDLNNLSTHAQNLLFILLIISDISANLSGLYVTNLENKYNFVKLLSTKLNYVQEKFVPIWATMALLVPWEFNAI